MVDHKHWVRYSARRQNKLIIFPSFLRISQDHSEQDIQRLACQDPGTCLYCVISMIWPQSDSTLATFSPFSLLQFIRILEQTEQILLPYLVSKSSSVFALHTQNRSLFIEFSICIADEATVQILNLGSGH